MERRVLIAVLLSFLVLYGYQALFPPPPEPKPAQSTSKVASAPKASGPTASNPTASVQGAPPEAEAATPVTPARDIEVDNADVHAVFTTRGAVLKSWKLKKYREEQKQPLEMIAGHAPADSPLPFTFADDDPALAAALAATPFTVPSPSSNPSGGAAGRRPLRVVVGPRSFPGTGGVVFCRPEGLRRAGIGRSRSRAVDRFRHVRVARRAAPARAEVAQRLRRELRLVAHSADDPHQ